ncbi:MAG TPA: AMP-binding protein [bacterium]|nr:AMP-binding protein [bacterium]
MFLQNHKKTAFIWKNEKISYHQFMEIVDKYASFLDDKAGSRIAIFSENRPEWAYAFYAAWKSNFVPLPIDFMSEPDEIRYILEDARPTNIFCSQNLKNKMDQATQGISYDPNTFVFEELNLPDESSADFPEMNKDDLAALIYTSGTTGSPKGVMLTFENLAANIQAISQDVAIYHKGHNVLILLPLHHTYPLMGTLIAPVYVGATMAFSPSMATEDLINTLQENAISLIVGVPRFYNLIMKGIKEKLNASKIGKFLFGLAGKINSLGFSRFLFKSVHKKFGGHVEVMACGGAALDKQLQKDFRTLGFEIYSGYGMTETGPLITFPRPGEIKMGAVGQPLSMNEVKIKDGEIITQGSNVMKGYYNLPEETDKVIKDGWLHTGDLGYFDDDNHLFITGRKKEIIILPSGKNINPVEIEFKLEKITKYINEIGVFMHHDLLQAVIVPDQATMREDDITDIEDYFKWQVIDKYNESVSPYKQIKKFHIIHEELPKTRLQKLRRFKLKDLIQDKKEEKEDQKEPDYKEYKIISDFIRKQVERDIFPGDHLDFDIGLDSLDKVSLQYFLKNTFGVEIKDVHLRENPTVHKLSQYVRKQSDRIRVEFVNWSKILREKVNIKLPESWFTQPVLKHIGKLLLRFYFKIRIQGLENIPDSPYILAPNHQSFIDGLLVAVGLSNIQLRKTYFYAKEKHVKKPWVKFLARKNNVIVVNIGENLKLSLQKMAAVLKQGENIIIFPEGTRTKTGKVGAFKKAFAILGKELNVPIVPVAISGAYNAMPPGSHFPKFKTRIYVRFLPPIEPEDKDVDQISELTRKVITTTLDKEN